jgi:hypothetical protein
MSLADHQVAARGHRVHQLLDDRVRVVGVRDEVQHGEQQDGNRLAEVQGPGGAGQDRVGIAQVRLEVIGRALGGAGEQRPGVGEHHRVVVDVDDPGVGRGPLRDFVGVVGRGQAGSDVKELPHAVAGRELVHALDDEPAHGLGDRRQGRHRRQHLLRGLAVGGEVILAAHPVVPHPGRTRDSRIEAAEPFVRAVVVDRVVAFRWIGSHAGLSARFPVGICPTLNGPALPRRSGSGPRKRVATIDRIAAWPACARQRRALAVR